MARAASEKPREELREAIESRFDGDYNPTLVAIDDEWHYPIEENETRCGLPIPDPVTAVKNSHFSGPSSFGCRECGVSIASPTKHDLQNQIRLMVGTDHNRAAQFNREDLLAIVQNLEEGASALRAYSEDSP